MGARASVCSKKRSEGQDYASLQETNAQVEELSKELKDLKVWLKTNFEAQARQAIQEREPKHTSPEPCSKIVVGPDDILQHCKSCARLHVDFLPGSELKLPRFMEIIPLDVQEAVKIVCPDGKERLNLAAVFKRFEEQPGTVLRRWTPLKELVSWSALQGRFEYILEHFVRHLPCGAEKTICQILTAVFERGRSENGHRKFKLEDTTYLVGVQRHTATTPFMPFGLWTHAAVFDFAHSVENNASKWLQSLLSSKTMQVRQGSFADSSQNLTEYNDQKEVSEAPEATSVDVESVIEIAIAAGGGSDVVTATSWLAHMGAPKGSLVFHPGRGKPASPNELLVSVPDFPDPLSKGKQFYEGTDLLARTQHLAKSLGLDYDFYFLLQDKNILGSGSPQAVLDHMNALAQGIADAVKHKGQCRRIHLVDSGGDVLLTVLQSAGLHALDQLEPRKERDVWNLLLALALHERFDCPVHLVVVAPGIDGQSVWLGPQPETSDTLSQGPNSNTSAVCGFHPFGVTEGLE
eukprot:gnl/MRDRNA2_/MRDRNA2_82963_c0_seq2.p1 gnl/MRDRNA2_/MRDRNA2_82963_c0~~gnl/MRDRNA2_/MRDRNA2_82963_c0_seq2.p1  ORF type:complete len:520 (-),score=86.76 gnl/MRDRNA2_/MRDRNA2_82963_c0_seq2:28-1587(-)